MISATMAMLILVLAISIVSIWSIQRVGRGGDIILKASSDICMIQDLRLSFEKVLMPPHDYLIYGKTDEIENFEKKFNKLSLALNQVSSVLRESESIKINQVEFPLLFTKEGITRIGTLATEILSIPDPLGLEAGRLMKVMDATTEQIKQDLEGLINIVSKDKDSNILEPVYRFMISFQGILMPPHDYLILGDKAERDHYKRLLPDLVKETDEILRLSKPGVERDIVAEVKRDFDEVASLAAQILAIEDPLKMGAAEKMKQMDFMAESVIKELDTLLDYFKSNAKIANQRADRIKSAAINFAIVTSLILVIGGLIGGLAFSSNITGPVRQLLEATQRISSGDLTHKAKVKSKDEIGELAKSFNRMTEDLNTYQGELINAKEYIDNIIKSMIDTLIVVDPFGKINTVNKAALHLLKYGHEGDLLGKPVERVFVKDAGLFSGKEMEMLIKEGSIRNYDTVCMTGDGVEIPINLSASAMRDKNGNLLGTVCVARDVREIQKLINDLKLAYKNLKSTQAQLIQSSRLASMGVLAAGVAHEINNPMNTIINYAGFLEDELDAGTDQADYVQGILKEGQRIINIVKDLLAFARADKQEHTPCRITDIINASLEFMNVYIAKDGINIKTSFSPHMPEIRCKFNQLQQVFINLILNSRDALNEKYPDPDKNKVILIDVKTIEKEGVLFVRIVFRDKGIGIPNENLDKIFDPFFTTKRADKGTGLGLSISYGIIADHKGSIKVESREGEHTTFIIDLPAEAWPV